jgi:hypothetical protein
VGRDLDGLRVMRNAKPDGRCAEADVAAKGGGRGRLERADKKWRDGRGREGFVVSE